MYFSLAFLGASHCCAADFMGYILILSLMHTVITYKICYSTCVASSSGVHSTFPTHMVFPKRSVILPWVSVLLLIAVLLLSWAVLYFSPFMLQSHVTSDVPHASRHLLVCTDHSLRSGSSKCLSLLHCYLILLLQSFMRKCIITITCPNLGPRISQRP